MGNQALDELPVRAQERRLFPRKPFDETPGQFQDLLLVCIRVIASAVQLGAPQVQRHRIHFRIRELQGKLCFQQRNQCSGFLPAVFHLRQSVHRIPAWFPRPDPFQGNDQMDHQTDVAVLLEPAEAQTVPVCGQQGQKPFQDVLVQQREDGTPPEQLFHGSVRIEIVHGFVFHAFVHQSGHGLAPVLFASLHHAVPGDREPQRLQPSAKVLQVMRDRGFRDLEAAGVDHQFLCLFCPEQFIEEQVLPLFAVQHLDRLVHQGGCQGRPVSCQRQSRTCLQLHAIGFQHPAGTLQFPKQRPPADADALRHVIGRNPAILLLFQQDLEDPDQSGREVHVSASAPKRSHHTLCRP